MQAPPLQATSLGVKACSIKPLQLACMASTQLESMTILEAASHHQPSKKLGSMQAALVSLQYDRTVVHRHC